MRLQDREIKAKNKSQIKTNQIDWQLWTPYPKQTELIDNLADVTGFGGSAGGSKSIGLLLLAIAHHKKSVIFRRTYPNLKEMIQKSRDMLQDSGARYNSTDKLWRLKDGRLIEFGSLQYEDDKYDWRGREHSLKAFDELTEFTRSQFEFVIGWCRSADPTERCRVVVTFNPPTSPEQQWVKDYFAAWLDPDHPNPAESGELRWFAMIDGDEVEVNPEPFEHKGELITPKSRTFIRAGLDDNPTLKNSGYRATLQAMPEPLRTQLLYGDFSLTIEDNPWQLIPTDWINAGVERWKAMQEPITRPDFIGCDVARGGSDKTVLCPRWKQGNYIGKMQKYAGKQTTTGEQVATLVMGMAGSETICNLDIIGVGSSPFDQMKHAIATNPIAFGGKSIFTDRSRKLSMANLRTEGYWRIREGLDPETGQNLAIPDDKELIQELKAHEWSLQGTVIKILKKDEVKEKIGRSPDSSDALAYSMFNSEFTVKVGDRYERLDESDSYSRRNN